MPAVTSAFDLPEIRAAKADPALITDDELFFTRLRSTLDARVAELTRRLAALRRAPAGSLQTAADRDREIHRITGQLTTLRRHDLDLTLGRIVPADGPPLYIGRLGLTDADGEPLLIDWRTPAAEPFFAATHGNPMDIASRRRYRWLGGRVSDYWDEVFIEGYAGAAALDDQSAFIASLGASRSGRMRDVLGTIQADQDRIIRASARGTLVVDGGPGTGKTVVALHRAAYLLYADPRIDAQRGGVLVVGPHHPYLAYVADVLPSLGEEGVQTCTLADLVPEGAAVVPEPDSVVAQLKSSARLVEAIEPAVRFYEEPPTESLALDTVGGEVVITGSDWTEIFDTYDPGISHNDARELIWEELVTLVVNRLDTDISPDLVRRSLARDEQLTEVFGRAWPLLDPTEIVEDLWSVPAYLHKCAPWLSRKEIRLLQRDSARAWTAADLPLLDAARRRVGDPEAVRRRRQRAAAEAAERAAMADVIQDLMDADDSDLGLMKSLRHADLRDALVDPDALPTADPDLLAGPFAHIVVDEAQELTDAEWQMLLSRCPSGSFTVVGDRAQARHGFAESWQERLARAGLRRVEEATLSINYRTPTEVMEAAAPVIRAVLPDANVPTSVRSNGIAVTEGRIEDLAALLEAWLAEHEGVACVVAAPGLERPDGVPGSAGIRGSNAALASDRVRWLSPQNVKGLEFDLVILLDPLSWGSGIEGAGIECAGIEGAVDRYVAMTRATQQLILLHP
ncbi:AAA family ATPase [Calidifontibacter sp. DB0510]|uniref:AAA family ATPase n=1 Tax=Metallococcus carri TaxID=1656884 RepID=A0A967EBD4_9MICO|nr:RNA polymerase recycling motor ATPase HelR [Metallococcus carri]NHN57195.1 AAA family ATPase [Metallococcus carri]NOP38002.1 AAA family ATPase [Calidifontibacter sp. DB2511S]